MHRPPGDDPPPAADALPATVGPWRRRSRERVYANPWIEVFHDEVDHPGGVPGIYGVVHFRGLAVGVVPVGDDGRILLVGQHRYPLDAYSWEIPEGGVDPSEAPAAGARRELREETGYAARDLVELCRVSLSNSVTDERGILYVARGLEPGEAAPEASEELALRWVTPAEALAMIDRGEIHDVLSVAGISRWALAEGLGPAGGAR